MALSLPAGTDVYASPEYAVALLIDELLGLGDRERDGVIAAVVGVRPDKLVPF